MKNIKSILYIALLTIFVNASFLVSPLFVNGQDADKFELRVGIENPLGDKKDLTQIFSSVLNSLTDIILIIVVIMIIYAGFKYVLAVGNSDKIKDAHKNLTWTLIGAAILLGAQLIANIVITTISNIQKDSQNIKK